MEGQRRAVLRVKMPDLAHYEIQRGAGVMSQPCDDPTDAAAWVIRAGLAGVPELDLLPGLCERAAAMGLRIARAQVLVDTLHRIHEGRVFRWQADRVGEVVEYGRTTENTAIADKWRQSPFHHLEQTGEAWLRRKLAADGSVDFPILAELGVWSRSVVVHCPVMGRMHYGRLFTRQRPHNAARSSRAPSVARGDPRR